MHALEPDFSAFIEQVTCDASLKTEWASVWMAWRNTLQQPNLIPLPSSGRWSNHVEKTNISEIVGSV